MESQAGPEDWASEIRNHIYALRGETVSVSGAIEILLRQLLHFYGHLYPGKNASNDLKISRAGNRWKRLLEVLSLAGLMEETLTSREAFEAYFDPRTSAAHSWVSFSLVGGTVDAKRITALDGTLQVESIDVSTLEHERDTVVRSHAALRSIGRALDQRHPEQMGPDGRLTRWLLLGTQGDA